jgi:alpha,alpha-trehalase
MTVWILCTALDMLALLPEDRRQELCESLDLLQKELDHWDSISRKMYVPIHDDGIISQFEGYEDLQEFDWEGYRKKYGNIQRLDRILEAEGDSPNRYKLSKQADVLMLFYLLSAEELGRLFNRIGYPFEPETIPKNVEYHLKRTSHGSTLSRIVHSWVLARSDRASSWELFVQALRSDIDDIQMGTTPEGIHLGAMAGTVDLLQRCSTGLEIRGDALWFNPCLPEELRRLLMRVRYRGHTIAIDITHERLRVSALRCAQMPITIGFREGVYHLREGDTKVFELEHLSPRGLPVKM